MKIKCLCINDTGKPLEIPQSKWLVKGNEYHIQHVFYHHQQGLQGVEITEHDISMCFPYVSYRLDRFAFTQEGISQLMEMIKECSQLNDIDVSKLVENLELIDHE